MVEVGAGGVKWNVRDGHEAELIEFLNARSDETHSYDVFERPRRIARQQAMRSPPKARAAPAAARATQASRPRPR